MKIKILLVTIALFLGSLGMRGQTTVFLFSFENTEVVTTDNAVGTPTFIASGVDTPMYFGGSTGNSRSYANWQTDDYYRFTVNTTGYTSLNFSYYDRTSSTAVGTFIARVSTDASNWTTIVSSYTSGTTFAQRTAALPPGFDNQTIVYIDVYKTNNADTATRNFRIDEALLTGTASADTTPPTITTLSPTNNAMGVTINSDLVLTFNENVVLGTAGNIVIYNSNNSVFETIPYNDGRISFNGTTGVTINPTGTFANNAGYYVQIPSTAIRDVALNNYAGIADIGTWNFTTVASAGKVSASSGDWNTDATWNPIGVPLATDEVTIKAGDIVYTTTTLTRNAATNVNGTFELRNGGFANGTNFTYSQTTGTLNFNTTGVFGVDNNHVYWPALSGPFNVNVLQGGTGNTPAGFSLNGSTRTINGTLSVTGTNVDNLGVVRLPSSTLIVNGKVQINPAGTFDNSPTYGNTSTLEYNNVTYFLNNEWNSTAFAVGLGVPQNVTLISSNVTLPAATRGLAGNLTIDTNSTLNHVANNALIVAGNWNNAGVFNANGGVVSMRGGASLQTITNTNSSSSNTENFSTLIVSKSAGTTLRLASDINVNGTTATPSGVFRMLDVGQLDLNGRVLSLNNNGGDIFVNVNATITSLVANGRININGQKTVANSSGTGSLTIGTNVTVNLNTNGIIDFGKSGSVEITTLNGTLSINSNNNCFINFNPPIYATGSLLRFNSGGNYDLHSGLVDVGGWFRNVASTGSAQAGIPWNVQITGSTSLRYNTLNNDVFPRYINGNLTIDSNSSFTLGGISTTAGDFFLRGNWTNNGTFNPNIRLVSFNGTTPQTLTGATTFDFLTLNNSNGLTLQASSAVTVNQTLALTSGRITLGANNLTVGGLFTVFSDSNYIVTNGTGQLRRTVVGATPIPFPIGSTASSYTPIGATNTGTSNVYGFRVADGVVNADDITYKVNKSWYVSRELNVSSNLRVIPSWNITDQGTNFSGPGNYFIERYSPPSAVLQSPATLSGTNPITATITNTGTNFTSAFDGTQYFAVAKQLPQEINIKQGVTNIASTGSFGFGNQISGTSSSAVTFTIENTGQINLTVGALSISGANAGEFSITQPVSALVTSAGTTTFTVTFSPTSAGAKSAQLSLINDDGNENPYLINLTGTGTSSAASNIIVKSGYTYPQNIAYQIFQATNISGGSNDIEIAQFTIQDGGGTADADNLGTTLSQLTLTITNSSNIRRIALYDGATEIGAEQAGAASVIFSGLNLTTTDGGTKDFSVRVSFNTAVTDNQNVGLQVTATTTASVTGSTFAATNAGGATTSVTGNNNKIVVIADRLAFVQQPLTTGINTALNFTLAARDVNSNVDADATNSITLTTTGTGATITNPYTLVAGLVTVANVQYNAAQTGRTITATTTGLGFSNSIISNAFDIVAVVFTTNDYRTILGTGLSWGTAAHWQRSDGAGGWNAAGTDGIPISTRNVYIRGAMTTNGSRTANRIIIESAGVLTVSAPSTSSTQTLVLSGGTVQLNAVLTNSGSLEIEDNGIAIINYVASNNSALWNGTEIFHPNSYVVIKEWDVNGTSNFRPLINGVKINTNTFNGYTAIFGNLIIDLSGSGEAAGSFIILEGSITINIAHNNLELINPEPTNNINIKGTGGLTTSGIGGNFIVDDAYAPTRKVIFSTSGALNFTIKGNMQLDGATSHITSSTAATPFTVTVEGNLNITAGAVLDFIASITSNPIINFNLLGNLNIVASGLLRGQSNGANFNFNFSGNSVQTIDIASTSATENSKLNFNIKPGVYVQLANRNFELGQNSKLTVEDGGTLDFGYAGTTPLNVTVSGSQTGTVFESAAGSILKITSPAGITTAGNNTGNVLTTTRTFSDAGTFHYIGKANQVTGNALPQPASAKTVIVEMDTDALTLSASATTQFNASGTLEIRKGTVNDTGSNFFADGLLAGQAGNLKMTGGFYKFNGTVGIAASDVFYPRLSGTYNLTGGEIELAANTGTNQFQRLRGGKAYFNLKISGASSAGGYKDVSSAITINNALTITGTPFFNSAGNGVSGTANVSMDGGRWLISKISEQQPELTGTYALSGGIMEFKGSSAGTQAIRVVDTASLAVEYNFIEITGSNVGKSTGNLVLRSGGKFDIKENGIFTINTGSITGASGSQTVTVENDAVFKTGDQQGFSGSNNTSVHSDIENINLENGSTVEYSRSNVQTITTFKPLLNDSSNLTTGGYFNLKITGDNVGNLTAKTLPLLPLDLIYVRNDLAVENTALLKIESGKTIIVNNKVTTVDSDNTKGIFIEDSGSLVQIASVLNASGNLNAGSIRMERITQPMYRLDYTYWSSPVVSNTLLALSPLTPASRFYIWNTELLPAANWVSQPPATPMTPGVGYIVRAPSTYPSDPGNPSSYIPYIANFNGIPNNGIVNATVYGLPSINPPFKWNLIGNPYPSALSADAFLDANSEGSSNNILGGTLYFWTHNTPNTNGAYTTDDYASWNSTGGVGTDAISQSQEDIPTNTPTGYIAAGQSFFVRGLANGSALFNNSMRVAALVGTNNNNNQFFKSSMLSTNESQTTGVKSRVWLNLFNGLQAFSQTLVGYIPNATNGYDVRFDGESFGGNGVTFYSVLDAKNVVIQGRALPFVNTDTVPLGYRTTLTGNLTIGIDRVDGVLEDQEIYLQDNLLNVVHDLNASDYTFAAVPGTFNSRFVLRYLPQENLSNPSFETQIKAVTVYKNEGMLHVHSPYETIATVAVYDITGRLIFERKNCNTNRFKTSDLLANEQALIVKVTLMNGGVVTEKVL